MNLLVTGKGTGGSWKIRGSQLGKAIGATVIPNALDVAAFDLAVLVKRPTEELLRRLHGARVPIVWDVVDSYPQPSGNAWNKQRCLAWLTDQVELIKPAGIVAATHAMAQDCARFLLPVLTLPHHARPGLKRNPIRPQVNIVGYEGGEAYLGRWRPVIETECAARGWVFVTQPVEMADVDIVLALRDCPGYSPRAWKSGVKAANAQGSGTPVICNREAGYLENQSGAEQWADNAGELHAAFDALTPYVARAEASRKLMSAAPSLDSISAKYLEWLRLKF